jgi:S1-C subfamily serine protease
VTRPLLALLCLTAIAVAPAPSTELGAEFGASVEKVRGVLLRTSEARGAAHLEREAAYDGRIARYLEVHGKPEILYVLDRWRVRLLYLREDRMVTFIRKSEERQAGIKGQRPLPERFLKRLEPAEQYLVLGVRAAASPAPPPDHRLGGCVSIGRKGLVLTAAHNLGEAETVRVRWSDGTTLGARVVERNFERDVALLRVADTERAGLSLAAPEDVRLGDRVFTIGFPAMRLLGSEPKFAEGAVSGEMQGKGGRLLITSVPAQAGNSGSPLVNEAGQVVGLLVGSASHGAFLKLTGQRPQNVNFAVPVADLHAIVPDDGTGSSAVDRRQAIERARRAICRVEATLP